MTRCGRPGGRGVWWVGLAGWLGMGCLAGAVWASGVASVLVFGETRQVMRGPVGTADFTFTFAFTNHARTPVVIESVRTSCGCTVAKVPELPWKVVPGECGEFSVVLDARGKRGTVTKSVVLNTSIGARRLSVRAIIEKGVAGGGATDADGDGEGGMGDRGRNMELARADRFAVFKGDCASCHAVPAEGKRGPALYAAVCGICHDSENRASMVPDLRNLGHATDREHWVRWITQGKEGTMMPGFARSEGGPLSVEQVESLADYLVRTISGRGVEGEAEVEGDGDRRPVRGKLPPSVPPVDLWR